ncbi:MAG: hypothetical protein KDB93_13830, partial [Flavobacteriales bacterium]|nr:hypothetical protein [Flavobacteriales bacterium]
MSQTPTQPPLCALGLDRIDVLRVNVCPATDADDNANAHRKSVAGVFIHRTLGKRIYLNRPRRSRFGDNIKPFIAESRISIVWADGNRLIGDARLSR